MQENMEKGTAVDAQWICNTPLHSDVEAKLRQLLVELRDDNQILGIQVCAYKDGKVIVDSAAGVLGEDDPRPVQPDTLFPVFSVTKGITAALLHWLVDKGKLKLDENVANVWPGFGTNGKEHIKVHHVLNHTSGLHNALGKLDTENALLICDWDKCLSEIAMSVPETEPGREQWYHYSAFGYLCGGIIEHVSGKKFQEILEEAIIHPLQIEGELYVGIPPGVESRLATVTLDMAELNRLSDTRSLPAHLPSTFQPELMASLPSFGNRLEVRRAILPSANGNFSARALARFYASLVDGGVIPPSHSSLAKPFLGSHPQIPTIHSENNSTNQKRNNDVAPPFKYDEDDSELNKNSGNDLDNGLAGNRISSEADSIISLGEGSGKGKGSGKGNALRIFDNPRIHDAFLGVGEYEGMVMKNGQFGLGFKRWSSKEGSFVGFGHTGFGGSIGFCHIPSRFALAVTVNRLSISGALSRKIIQFLCSQLNISEFNIPLLGTAVDAEWVYNTPLHSDVEAKLRQFLVELRDEYRIIGIQLLECLVRMTLDQFGLTPFFLSSLQQRASQQHYYIGLSTKDVWPGFGTNGKEHIKVHHVLNHTAGLPNALGQPWQEIAPLMSDWDKCLSEIAMSVPETEPGREQVYHHASFGWLCGGIIEHVSGKKFQEILEEVIIHPLQVEGEMYIGIPPGVESRLATVTMDTVEINRLIETRDLPAGWPSSVPPERVISVASFSNTLELRRAIVPSGNGNFSARALARFYASLVDGGVIPPSHSSLAKPFLGSHPHIPTIHSGNDPDTGLAGNSIRSEADSVFSSGEGNAISIFDNPRIHDAFLGVGEYEGMAMKNVPFGLGFTRWKSNDGSIVGFGHSGFGGSTGFCHISGRFAASVILLECLEKMTLDQFGLTPFFLSSLQQRASQQHYYIGLSRKGEKVKLDENVANVWPGFGTNGKEHIKVHHVLNHTSGLHNALGKSWLENASLICDWDKCLSEIATSVPETEPGREQWYHYSSFGWLCGGHTSGKKFQEILEEAIIHPLQIEGELYIGIPPGVESRLATATLDTAELEPIASLISLCNMLEIRRAILPSKQNKDVAPPFKYNEDDTEINKNFGNGTNTGLAGNGISTYSDSVISLGEGSGKGNAIRIFKDPRIHDAFLGEGEYEDMVLKNGEFGLGFKRWSSNDGSFVGFGHRGFGGSTGFCHIPSRFAVAVTVNRLSITGAASRKIIQFLSSELNIPLPEEL
ncbi:hypothetical protein Tsubulata_013528 [Turnera subulata]|uniref:Beta-lactamase-related domain-containing protein n=1 Tax=Turnera subulata TaxID=218843 RepID=A0A9Q0GAC2_9ROSI|nr:hypothetical protein Tsubulata_013528 [Turnera subulata]